MKVQMEYRKTIPSALDKNKMSPRRTLHQSILPR